MTETHKYVYGKLRRNAIAFGSQVPDWPALAPQIENTEREEIIRGALAVVGQIAVESAHTAVMARNVSMRTMQNLRREVALVRRARKTQYHNWKASIQYAENSW